jgi:hypothetical protein
MKYSPFHRQLTSEEEKRLFNRYEKKFLNVCNLHELKELSIFFESEWDGELPKWFLSLHNDIVKAAEKIEANNDIDEDSYDIFFEYFLDIEMEFHLGISQDDILISADRLSSFKSSGYDLSAPHFVWLNEIDKVIGEVLRDNPEVSERKALSYAWNASGSDISPKLYVELFKMRDSQNYHGMTINQFIKWYERSSKIFNQDAPVIEKAQKMGRVLDNWCPDGKVTQHDIENLCSSFKVHPIHRPIVADWSEKFIKTKPENDSSNELSN